MGMITATMRKLLHWEERIDPGPGPVGDTLSEFDVCWGSLIEPVSVQDIWSGSTSVEDVDARPRSWEGNDLVNT